MKKKILLIVDMQYDFINDKLKVNGATEMADKLADYINNNHDEFDSIVLTADWHPINHCSFKHVFGIWPIHCVQHTHGAAIHDSIMNAIFSHNIPYKVYTKGEDNEKEEYSFLDNERNKLIFTTKIISQKIEEIEVVGLCGDYCVHSTIQDLLKLNLCKVKANKEFILSIDGGTKLEKLIKNNNL